MMMTVELPMYIHCKHKNNKRACGQHRQQQHASCENPHYKLLNSTDAWHVPTKVGLINYITESVKPHSISLFQHYIVAQSRMLFHVTVKIRRLTLLYKPFIVQNILLSPHESSMKHVCTSCDKTNNTQSKTTANATKYYVA
jgi:hypothetical protein